MQPFPCKKQTKSYLKPLKSRFKEMLLYFQTEDDSFKEPITVSCIYRTKKKILLQTVLLFSCEKRTKHVHNPALEQAFKQQQSFPKRHKMTITISLQPSHAYKKEKKKFLS